MKKINTLIVIAFVNFFSNAHAMDEIRILQNDELKKTNYIKIHVWDPGPEIPGHASLEIIGVNAGFQKSIDYISVKKGCIYHNYSEDLEDQNNKIPTTFVVYCINGKNVRNYYDSHQDSLYHHNNNNGFYVPLHLLKKAGALEALFPDRTYWDLLPSAQDLLPSRQTVGGSLALETLGASFYPFGYTNAALLIGSSPIIYGGLYGGYKVIDYFWQNGLRQPCYNVIAKKDTDLYESNVTHNQLKSLLIKACKFQQEKYINMAEWFPNGPPTAEEADALADLERRMLQLEQNSMKTTPTPQ